MLSIIMWRASLGDPGSGGSLWSTSGVNGPVSTTLSGSSYNHQKGPAKTHLQCIAKRDLAKSYPAKGKFQNRPTEKRPLHKGTGQKDLANSPLDEKSA